MARLTFERNLDWNLLKIFHEIARSGGVSRAADRLARQQPAVSSALKRLEDYLETTLCRRGPRGFELTDEGQALAELCRRIFSAIEEIPGRIEDVADDLQGQLRIVMVQNLVSPILDKTIADFSRAHPKVELLINVAMLDQVESVVVRNDAEIGIAPVPMADLTLRYDFLYREQHRPFCGRSHPLFGRTFEDPRALAEEVFILPGVEEAESVRDYRGRYDWGRRSIARSPYLDEVKRLVVAGLGIGFLPAEMLEGDIRNGLLWPLMAPQLEAQADVLVFTNPAAARSRAISRFLTIMEANRDGNVPPLLEARPEIVTMN